MGIMFLVFVPTPYVDACTAWSFPSRWQRMFVGAAGMIFELVLRLALRVCLGEGHGPIRQLVDRATGVTTRCSSPRVTTIIFNANPLLRYDGYYMLSDWLEIPNLRQKSREYLMGLIKRHIFRIKSQQPLPPPGQRLAALSTASRRAFIASLSAW